MTTANNLSLLLTGMPVKGCARVGVPRSEIGHVEARPRRPDGIWLRGRRTVQYLSGDRIGQHEYRIVLILFHHLSSITKVNTYVMIIASS